MLWTVDHILNTEARLQKLAADAYKIAEEEIFWPDFMVERPGEGARQDVEWLLTTADIYRLNSDGDGIRYDDLITQGHSVTHEDFGTGLIIKRKQFEDDAFGFAGEWARQVGSRMALDPQYELVRMMLRGEIDLAYDGLPFYAPAHPNNPQKLSAGTYDTLITDLNQLPGGLAGLPSLVATGADPGANLQAAVSYIKMLKLPNNNAAAGRPRYRHLKPDILRVPPILEIPAQKLANAAFIGATENMVRKYQLEVIVVDELAEDPAGLSWYLDCKVGETPDLKPFVRFNRLGYELTSFTGMTQAELGRRKKLEWQLYGRYGYMYGHPYQSFKFKVPT